MHRGLSIPRQAGGATDILDDVTLNTRVEVSAKHGGDRRMRVGVEYQASIPPFEPSMPNDYGREESLVSGADMLERMTRSIKKSLLATFAVWDDSDGGAPSPSATRPRTASDQQRKAAGSSAAGRSAGKKASRTQLSLVARRTVVKRRVISSSKSPQSCTRRTRINTQANQFMLQRRVQCQISQKLAAALACL